MNACHAHGVAVILDVVYNHLNPEGNYLAEFGPYFTDRYKTPWGPAMNFDGEGSRGVRDFVIANALYWVREYHILSCGLEDCAVRLEMPPGSWRRRVLPPLGSPVSAAVLPSYTRPGRGRSSIPPSRVRPGAPPSNGNGSDLPGVPLIMQRTSSWSGQGSRA